MDFEFSDDQVALRDAVRRWTERGYGFERRQAFIRAGGASRAVYGELADLGLAAVAVPTEHGGLGLGPVDTLLVCEELGRGLVASPYIPAAVMAPALLQAAMATAALDDAAGAQAAAWLPRLAAGEVLVVPALQERSSRYRLTQVSTRARQQGEGWLLDGEKCVVPAADEADAFLVPARLHGAAAQADGIGLFLLQRADLTAPSALSPYPTHDGARAGDLRLHAAPATLLCAEAEPALAAAVDAGIAAQCAEGVGLMERLLHQTAEYLNTRRQFGTPLSSFQALRHRMADMQMQLELGRSMSYYATLKLGEAEPARRRAISQARVQLGRSMRFVGQQAIQLHGGIGCTDDCSASHAFKRLSMLELSLGDTAHHLGEVSARLEDTAGVFT